MALGQVFGQWKGATERRMKATQLPHRTSAQHHPAGPADFVNFGFRVQCQWCCCQPETAA